MAVLAIDPGLNNGIAVLDLERRLLLATEIPVIGEGANPSKMAQKIRCATGASTFPPAVMVSITNEPESDEVQKNTITRTMPTKDVIAVSGRCDSMAKSLTLLAHGVEAA